MQYAILKLQVKHCWMELKNKMELNHDVIWSSYVLYCNVLYLCSTLQQPTDEPKCFTIDQTMIKKNTRKQVHKQNSES